ncbi:hypothetical protein TI39_contig443g00012 [Zymoseptoria brevis]|uniref:SET domain-containing protein n=1 Tax=Zymoseptoria brevis TaxID=1047168 RepID=A0A0F4GKU7_9PEZI|nr:hypothetical protein TI39_contig443g00012 [Zymoseptoria brevis]
MPFYEVRQIEGKGQGVVATQKIPRGSVILTDKPILSVSNSDWNQASAHRAIEEAFKRLSKQDQATYLSLHDGRQERNESKAVRIFHTNAFGADTTHILAPHTKYVLPLVSRLNHSCVPNAVNLAHTLYAQKDILPGEEIQICYQADCDEVMTAVQRNFLFRRRYAFECNCKACLPGSYQRLSDTRRVLIGALRFALEQKQPLDFRTMAEDIQRQSGTDAILRAADWPPKTPSIKPVKSPSQEIEYTFHLAMLREAEGLQGVRTAQTFYRAAHLLLSLQSRYGHMGEVQGCAVIFVEAVRCYEAWMNKAIEHAARIEGPTGGSVTSLQKILRSNESNEVWMLAKQMANANNLNGDPKKKFYAILQVEVDEGEEDSYFRFQCGKQVRYVTIAAGVYTADVMVFAPDLFPLPGVEDVWHPINVDHLDVVYRERLRNGVYRVTTAMFAEVIVAKFAVFEHEIGYLNSECAAYQWIEGQNIGPKFLGNLVEDGRVIGFLMGDITDARHADIDDLSLCQEALRRLHQLGILHGDANKHNFLIKDGRAVLIDFDTARKCDDQEEFAKELNGLDEQLNDASGRGGMIIVEPVAVDASACVSSAASGALRPNTKQPHHIARMSFSNADTGGKTADPYVAKNSQDPSLKEKAEDFTTFAEKTKYCLLTTKNKDNLLVSRAMAIAGKEGNGVDLIFHTNTESGKTDDLENSPEVNVGFIDSSGQWASVSGAAKVETDRSRVREYYSQSLKAWLGDLGDGKHDGGPEDPRIGLIRVKAHTITYAISSKNIVTSTIEVAKGALTGQTAQVNKLRHLDESELQQWRSS